MQLCRVAVVLAFVGLVLPPCTVCQPSSVEMPKDAAALMRLAHDKNGFTGADIRPWHMRGTYHSYQEGKLEYEGKYEEWWFSPTQYKLTFSKPGFAQTDYANGTTLSRDGEQEWLSGPELLLRASLVDPLPDPGLLANFKLRRGPQTIRQAKLDCVNLTYKIRNGPEAHEFPFACFEPTMPVLRIFINGVGPAVWYDHIVLVQGHYIAHEIRVFYKGNLAADLNVESIQELQALPETMVTPPSSAVPVDLTRIAMKPAGNRFWPMPLIVAGLDFIYGGPSRTPANRTNAVNQGIASNPDRPRDAGWEIDSPKVEKGTVVVKVRVRPDGRVESAEVVSGVVRLQNSALAAARQWVFRPFAIMGEARAVETELSFGVELFGPDPIP